MDFTTILNPATGATGILTLVVLLVLWGKIVPRSTLDDMRADKDKQIETWRSAYEKSETAREIQRAQITDLLEIARTTNTVIQALPVPGANSGRRPHADVPQEEDHL